MLRLGPVARLKKDVWSRLGEDTAAPARDRRGLHDAGIAFLGRHAATGNLVVTYHARDAAGLPHTGVALYELKTGSLREVYRRHGAWNVVSASLDAELSVLAYTVVLAAPPPAGTPAAAPAVVYESVVVELSSSVFWPLFRRSYEAQAVCITGAARSKKYILFVANRLLASLYAVPLNKDGRVTGAPKPESPLLCRAGSLAWHSIDQALDDSRGSGRAHPVLLYMLTLPPKGDANGQLWLYRCVRIARDGPQTETLFEIPLRVPHLQVSPSLRPTPPPTEEDGSASGRRELLALLPFDRSLGILPSTADEGQRPFLTQLRLHSGGLVLCMQHPLNVSPGSLQVIDLSLFVIQRSCRVDISVQLHNVERAFWYNCRVHFNAIGDLVLVYIPGFYFELIDCGEDHEPTASFVMNGSDFATPLPGQESSPTSVPYLSFFDAGYRLDAQTNAVDNASGIIYSISIDRGAILRLFDLNSQDLHVQALHVATVHLHDMELVDKIMRHLCNSQSVHFTSTLMREYLIGKPFLMMKRADMPAHLRAMLMATSLEPMRAKNNKPTLSIQTLPIPSSAAVKPYVLAEPVRRFPVGSFGAAVDVVSRDESAIRRVWRYLWKDSDSASSLSDSGETATIMDPDSARYVERLTDYMTTVYPAESRRLAGKFARDFRCEQIHATQELFDYIRGAIHKLARFLALENMYFSLEELQLQLPHGAAVEMTRLGMQYLPRSLFLQYIDRGVLSLSHDNLRECASRYEDSDEDRSFKFALASRTGGTTFAQDMFDLLGPEDGVIEHCVASLLPSQVQVLEEVPPQQYRLSERGFFIPYEVLAQRLSDAAGPKGTSILSIGEFEHLERSGDGATPAVARPVPWPEAAHAMQAKLLASLGGWPFMQ